MSSEMGKKDNTKSTNEERDKKKSYALHIGKVCMYKNLSNGTLVGINAKYNTNKKNPIIIIYILFKNRKNSSQFAFLLVNRIIST